MNLNDLLADDLSKLCDEVMFMGGNAEHAGIYHLDTCDPDKMNTLE